MQSRSNEKELRRQLLAIDSARFKALDPSAAAALMSAAPNIITDGKHCGLFL
jgi:hypothetical protein